ncbi:hypothetical protein AUP68_03812 [Ilyonectria robusta]
MDFNMNMGINFLDNSGSQVHGSAPNVNQAPEDPYQLHSSSLERSAIKEWLIHFLTNNSDIIGMIQALNLDKEAEKREMTKRSLVVQQMIQNLFNCEVLAERLLLLQDASFYHVKRAELQDTYEQLKEAIGDPVPNQGWNWEAALEKMASKDPNMSALFLKPMEAKQSSRRDYKRNYRRGRTGYQRGNEIANN